MSARGAAAATFGVSMHGATLNVCCEHQPLRDYAVEMLGAHVCAPWPAPDLAVEASWRTPATDDELLQPAFDLAGLDAFGKRMHVGPGQVVWTNTHRDPNLQLRCRRDGTRTVFDVVYHFRPSPKKLAKYPDYERKKYFDLLRHLVWFPLLWHLQRRRGFAPVHASCVRYGGRGVLIAGPGGAGKTTTCVALAARAGMTLLAENLALCDGEHVHALHEPIRLTAASLELLGGAAGGLRPLAGGLAKKAMFAAPFDESPAPVRPAALFLARFCAPGFVRALAPVVAYDLLAASNALTLELDDFHWYAAAFDLLWAGERRAAADPLRRLCRSTPCYTLGIDRSESVDAVVDRVLACLPDARRVREEAAS